MLATRHSTLEQLPDPQAARQSIQLSQRPPVDQAVNQPHQGTGDLPSGSPANTLVAADPPRCEPMVVLKLRHWIGQLEQLPATWGLPAHLGRYGWYAPAAAVLVLLVGTGSMWVTHRQVSDGAGQQAREESAWTGALAQAPRGQQETTSTAWHLNVGGALSSPTPLALQLPLQANSAARGPRLHGFDQESPEQSLPTPQQRGYELFVRDWSQHKPPEGGDGLGPLFNATSCAACHSQPGVGGAGPIERNVQTVSITQSGARSLRQGWHGSSAELGIVLSLLQPEGRILSRQFTIRPAVPVLHRHSTHRSYQRWRDRVLLVAAGPWSSVEERRAAAVLVNERNTPALWGAGLIDSIPNSGIVKGARRSNGKVPYLKSGGIGRFGWRGERARLADFVKGACAMELGLNLPENKQPSSPWDVTHVEPTGYDMTRRETSELISYVASLPRPVQDATEDVDLSLDIQAGELSFHRIGCASCHKPDLGGVAGLYSDLLLHEMGPMLSDSTAYYGSGSDSSGAFVEAVSAGSWQTPPLWGVADSAPYLHDGRADTLHLAIELHDGQGKQAKEEYLRLSLAQRSRLIAFLRSLKAPPRAEQQFVSVASRPTASK